jgi:hypothetical protein
VGALASCARGSAREGADTPAASGAPVLTAIAPETISLAQGAVPTLVITGRGFVPGGGVGGFADGNNILLVGRATFTGVGSDSSGTTIRFALPLTYVDTTLRGRPANFEPGQYQVSVSNARGTSNAITLTMIR